jgi:dipeptidyl aminopeptidase/acylaminoacyl peptidase
VLQPNFRWSGGYDTAFIEAGYGQWGRKMQTDLSDGVAFLASQGIVDQSRVCIMGASYGGYAALAGVTLQRDVYRCAVAIAPVTDVRDFLAWRAVRSGEDTSTLRYWTRYLGVTDRNDRALDAISTVRAAGGDDAPVLLIHGRDDTIVPYQQSEAAQRALSAAGRSVELVPLRQEDHYLSREATRIQTLNAAVAFIERHNPPN